MPGFDWKDISGEIFHLPRIPSSRDDLERLLEEAKAQRAAEAEVVPPPTIKSTVAETPGVVDKLKLLLTPGMMGARGQEMVDQGVNTLAESIPEDVSNLANRGLDVATLGLTSGVPDQVRNAALKEVVSKGLGLATAPATAAIPELGPVSPLVTLPFAAEAASGGGEQLGQALSLAKDQGYDVTDPKVVRLITGGLLDLGFSGMMAGHARGQVGEVGRAVERRLERSVPAQQIADTIDQTSRGLGYTELPEVSWMNEPGGKKPLTDAEAARIVEERNKPEPGFEENPSPERVAEMMKPVETNASGESSVSLEAMNRLKSMQGQGQKFVVYDQAGRARPIIGADAVDYTPQRGETFGIEGPNGFETVRSHQVPGKVPGAKPEGAAPPAEEGLPPVEEFGTHEITDTGQSLEDVLREMGLESPKAAGAEAVKTGTTEGNAEAPSGVQLRSPEGVEANPAMEGVGSRSGAVQGVQGGVQAPREPGKPGEGRPLEPEVVGASERLPTEDPVKDLAARWNEEGFTNELADDMEGWTSITPEEAVRLKKEAPGIEEQFPFIQEAADRGKPGATKETAIDVTATPVETRPERQLEEPEYDPSMEYAEGTPRVRASELPPEVKASNEKLIENLGKTKTGEGALAAFEGDEAFQKYLASKGIRKATETVVTRATGESHQEVTYRNDRGQRLTEGKLQELHERMEAEPPLALEGAPPPKSFTEFMEKKFGSKTTTSKERAIARVEWVKEKERRKILKMADAAGIPPEKVQQLLDAMPPAEGPLAGSLSAWRRAALPVVENFGTIHPWLKDTFKKYIGEAEAPAMKNIADSWRIRQSLSKAEQKQVIEILDGKTLIDETTPTNVKQAAINYRAMLDQVWRDAVAAGVRKATDLKRQNYFPHKFAEGWDDNLVQNLHLDKNWNLRESSLEKARLSKRADYRRDLDVMDEYFLSAYRRISEVQNFGKRLQVLRRFARKHVADKQTAEWLQTNIRRIMGREHPGSFDRFSGHVRHVQALTDLGLAGFYQPIQAINTTLYGGLGRSVRALAKIATDKPNEVYDAIRSGSLTPDITQELIQGAYGAREHLPTRAAQKFMWGIPTIDKWTRIHANTVGKMMVGDALKGSKGALKDINGLGFDFKTLDELKAAMDKDPELGLKVGKELSDKALFRTGTAELPGWASSTPGKLATQYTRFMYRHSLFVKDIFAQAGKGNVRPLARLLTVAPVMIPAMAEVLYPIREGLRELARQGVAGEGLDLQRVAGEALGDENLWDEEIQWYHILRNKRIPLTHPLMRALQNTTMWGGIGIFQLALERAMGSSGSPLEAGAKAFAGPVPINMFEAAGSVMKDLGNVKEDVEWGQPPGKYTRRWGARQIPFIGYPLARRMREELGE